MPPYIPPSGCSADFTSISVWVLVPCSAANFDLIGSNIGITVVDSSIDINSSVAFFLSGSLIEIEESFINIASPIVGYQTLSEITTYPSIIQVTSDTSLFRILPDCIIEPSYVNIESSIQEVRAGRQQDLPNKLSGNFSTPWDTADLADEFYGDGWEQADKLDQFMDLPISVMDHIDDTIDDGWVQLGKLDNTIDNKIGVLSYIDIGIQSFWHVMEIADRHSIIPWGNAKFSDRDMIIPYNEPGANDRGFKTSFTTFAGFTDHWFVFLWNEPGAKDKQHLVPWGPLSYFPFCKNVYYPPDACSGVNFKAKALNPKMIGVCYEVVFDPLSYGHDIRCPFKHYQSGRRDPYINTGIIIHPVFPVISKESYYMQNIAFAQLVSTLAPPIEILGATITIDKQSWLWQYSVVIGSKDSLDLIKPEIAGDSIIYKDIEIYVNGWWFTCRVESWSENRSFGKDTWTVTGRSPSMELGSPQNPVSSYRHTGGVSAGGQIMELILEGTPIDGRADLGWTIDWTYYNDTVGVFSGFDPVDGSDWGIPDGTFSWVDKTQIEAVQMLASSIKAYVQTVPNCKDDKRLLIKPEFHVPPWHWSPTSLFPMTGSYIDHVIPDGVCREIGRTFTSMPTYNAVFVMGQSSVPAQESNPAPGIVFGEVYRFGWGPSDRVHAPNFTDPWVTTIRAANEAGRAIICNTGEWVYHTLSLFSLAPYGALNSDLVALVLPGDYVQVTEKGVNWFGTVESTSLSIVMASGAAVSIVQTINVHEYIGVKTVRV